MNRLKNIILNIILILGSCVFILLILEIGVRIFFPAIRPQMIVKKASSLNVERELEYGKPFFEGTFLSAEYRMEIKTNSQGFRDIEHELNKPKDTFRILVVGDSFTFGWGVEANQMYSKILQKLLNEKNADKRLRYEIFNMGINNIGTLEEMQIIKYGIRYNPDLILLGLFVENRWNPGNGNDLCDNLKSWYKSKNEELINKDSSVSFLRFKIKFIDYLNSFQHFLVENSKLYFLIMTKKGTILRKHLIKFREGQNRYELDTGWNITKDALKKINTLAQEVDAEFVIIRIPFLFDVYNQGEDRVSKILAEFGRKNNINICDLLTILRNNKNKDLYYPADGHWTAQAHTLAASAVFNYLVHENLIVAK